MSSGTSKRWKYGPPETTSKNPNYKPPVSGGKDPSSMIGDNKSTMDSVKDKLKKYKDPLLTGALGVVIGYGAKKLIRSDHISTGSLKQAGMSFVMISLAGVAAHEINVKYM